MNLPTRKKRPADSRTQVKMIRYISLVLFLTSCACDGAERLDTIPAVWSAAVIRAGIKAQQEKIESISVTYQSGAGTYLSATFPHGTYLHRVVIAAADGSLFHLNAHGTSNSDWKDDLTQQRCYVQKTVWYRENPLRRTYSLGELEPDDPLPGSMPHEFFFLTTGIWPFRSRPAPQADGHSYMLKDVAVSKEYDTVLPIQDEVAGRWCHVLEAKGIDRLWIDVDRGCALVARELFNRTTGAAEERIELSQFTEMSDGVWLPKRIRDTSLNDSTTVRQQMTKPRDATFDILEYQVNTIDSHVFNFNPPPGALCVTDHDNQIQTVPGGLDYLEQLAQYVEKYSHRLLVRSRSTVVGIMCAIVVVVLSEAYLRWIRKRPAYSAERARV